jgi:hypothetical protein
MQKIVMTLLGTLALTVAGCGDNNLSCGAGTVDDGKGNCVAADMAGVQPDLSGGSNLTCGDKTLNENGVCNVQDSVCLTGTTFDKTTHTCTVAGTPGTQVVNENFLVNYIHLYYADTTTSPTAYKPAGTPTTTAQADATMLFLSDGTPMAAFPQKLRYAGNGGTLIPNVPMAYDPTNTTPGTFTKQLTIGDYKKCNASVKFFKPADYNSTTNPKYLMVVDAAGCPANYLYTVWFFYTPSDATDKDAAFNARSFAAPAGGMPNVMVTDDKGQGHWERLIDASVYFKHGTNVPWGAAHSTTVIPDAPGLLLPTIVTHPYAQSNGNPLLCVLSAVNAGKCYNPATVGDMASTTKQFYAQATGNPGLDSQFSNTAYVNLDMLQP